MDWSPVRTARTATWPVMLVITIALAGTATLAGVDADDLDPLVWQAIVAQADVAASDLFEPLTGEF
jgi:hypothetical protein